MANEESEINALFADFNRRMTDLEASISLMRDKSSTISRTLLLQGDKFNKDLSALKDEIEEIKDTLARQSDRFEHILQESSEFVRREELKSMERLMKTFEPMQQVTEEDVRRIVKEERE